MASFETAEDLFWSHVVAAENCCWAWTGQRVQPHIPGKGHGRFCFAGKERYAHRFSWELHNGPIPDGLFVLHHCDVTRCVNPAHLYVGTQKQNVADRERRGRGVLPPSRAKLSAEQVLEVRERLLNGEKHGHVARDYQVGRTAIWHIAHNKTYQESK